METVELVNEKNIAFGVEGTDEISVHTVAQGCRWNLTRAGSSVISTQVCLYGLKWRVGWDFIKASDTKNLEHCGDGDQPQHPKEAEMKGSPTGWSGCTVTELELSGKWGLQGANSPLWPRHSFLFTGLTSSFHIFCIPTHDTKRAKPLTNASFVTQHSPQLQSDHLCKKERPKYF